MNTTVQDAKSPHLLIWVASIAVILFSGMGIAAIMGWIPTSMGRSVDGAAVTAPDKRSTNSLAPVAQLPRANPATRIAPSQVAERAPARAQCADCGVVESTREVSAKGTGSGVGAVGGAVVGGLLGNQVGSGRDRIAAVGGAVAGNEVEKRVKATKSREVTVRLDDGSSRIVNEGSSSPWHTGDRVKIVSGEIHAHP